MRVCEPLEHAYLREQEAREKAADQQAEEWGFATAELAELVRIWGKAAIAKELAKYPDTQPADKPSYAPQCGQCVQWRSARPLQLSDGSTVTVPGSCQLRAAADLEQMPQDYAARCHHYEENIPF